MSCPCSDCSDKSVSAGQCLQGRSSPSATLTSWCRPLPDRRRSSRPSTSPVSAPGAARLSLTVWGAPAGQPVVQTHLGRRGELGHPHMVTPPTVWLQVRLCCSDQTALTPPSSQPDGPAVEERDTAARCLLSSLQADCRTGADQDKTESAVDVSGPRDSPAVQVITFCHWNKDCDLVGSGRLYSNILTPALPVLRGPIAVLQPIRHNNADRRNLHG